MKDHTFDDPHVMTIELHQTHDNRITSQATLTMYGRQHIKLTQKLNIAKALMLMIRRRYVRPGTNVILVFSENPGRYFSFCEKCMMADSTSH